MALDARRRLAAAAAVVLIALLAALAGRAHAALSPVDLEAQALEFLVADDPRAALRQSESWEADARRTGDSGLELKALRLMTLASMQLEESARLGELAARGLALARQRRDAQVESEFLMAQGVALAAESRFQEAQRMFDEAIAVADRAGLKRAAAGVLVSKAFVLGLQGHDLDALDLLFRARQSFESIGDAVSARVTLSAIGDAYAHDRSSRDDLLKAIGFHERAIAPDAARHRRHELATIYFNMGVVYQRLKDMPKAAAYLQKAMALFRELDNRVGLAFGNYRLGVMAGDAGRWSDALAYEDLALPVIVQAGDSTMIFNVQRTRARALAQLDRKRDSLEALAHAEAIRAKAESSWMDVNFLAAAAEVYGRLGDFEKAWRHQVALRAAEERSFREAREKESAEVQTRYEVRQKEAENDLLRARERESEARRVALALALMLLLFVLGGLGLYLFRQSRQNRRFAALAMRDELTGLPNRRSILEFARVQLRNAGADGTPLCLALLDIDHFKSINDECGHAAGDAVLTAFAAVCVQQLRGMDRLGRYGGEEFMLVMPGTDIAQMPLVFARLRAAIQDLNAPGMAVPRRLTFSMGASAANAGDDLDKLTKRADDALYRAKQGGRDRHEVG